MSSKSKRQHGKGSFQLFKKSCSGVCEPCVCVAFPFLLRLSQVRGLRFRRCVRLASCSQENEALRYLRSGKCVPANVAFSTGVSWGFVGFVRSHHTRMLIFAVSSSPRHTLCTTLSHYNHAYQSKGKQGKTQHRQRHISKRESKWFDLFSARQCDNANASIRGLCSCGQQNCIFDTASVFAEI